MPKIRKQNRKKTYKHTVNRKKLNKKKKRLPKIKNEIVKEAWDVRMSVTTNLLHMGLSSDPNVSMAIPKAKDKIKKSSGDKNSERPDALHAKFPRLAVAEQLEKESKERKRKTLRLSQMIVDRLGHFIQKYGNDYKAMTRDRLNYDQHTWKQIRAQIKKFMGIPEQWNDYWTSINLSPPDRCIFIDEDENMDN